MKKYFAILVAMFMLLSAVAFADANVDEVGKKLKSYGVIKGDERGLRPDDQLPRQEALVILIRMLGKEEEALSNVIAPSFIDVGPKYWAKPYIGYAQSNKLTNGIGDNMFGVDYNITTQQAVAYMLRALGYGEAVPYEQSMIKGTQLGLLNDLSDNNPAAEITRGNMFILMDNTLNTKAMGAEQELIYDLGLEKLDKEKEEEPKKEPEKKEEEPKKEYPDESRIDRIVNNGLKQILVYFDAPVKSPGNISDYDLSTRGSALIDKNSSVSLSKDGMIAILDLTQAAKNQEKIDLEITGVADNDRKFKNYEMFDQDIPKVKEAVVVGEKTIKVVFTEPMDKGLTDREHYRVKDKKGSNLSVKRITAQKNNTVALVDVYSRLADEASIEVKKIYDYAGYHVAPETFELEFDVDKDEPEIVNYENANLTSVTLIFDEDIKVLKDAHAFYHTNKSNKAKEAKAEGNRLILKFRRGDELPAGTAYIYIEEDAISDYWDNENDDRIRYEVKVEADKEEPKLKDDIEVVKQDEIVLEFDEDIQEGNYYKVELEKHNRETDIRIKSYFEKNELRLKFSEDLVGKYKLYVKGVEDEFGNEIDNLKISLDMDDMVAPKAKNFTAMAVDVKSKNQIIIVDFKDEMDQSDIEDPDKYQLDGKDLDDLDAEIVSIDNNRKVEITIPEKKYDLKNSDLDKGNGLLEIARMSDAAGNKMDKFSVTLDIRNGHDTVLEVREAALIERNKVEFRISGELDEINIKQFKIFSDNDELDIDDYEADESHNKATIVVELDDKVSTNPKEDELRYEILSTKRMKEMREDPSQNRYMQVLVGSGGDIKDECAPVLDKAVLKDDDTILLYFSEDLSDEYFSRKGKNGFDVDGGKIEKAILKDDNVVEIKGRNFTRSTDIIYRETNICDKHDNELKSFEYSSKLERD